MSIAENLQQLIQNIIDLERQFARPTGSVKLLAVSKSQPVALIQQAIVAGQREFGENYVQEAVAKISAINDQSVTWHFIGAIQSNKIKLIAQHFQWVHSVDSLQHAERLNLARPDTLPPLNVCIQVNVDAETSKTGVALNELSELAHGIIRLPRLRLRGLMAIPAPRADFNLQCKPFHKLRMTLQELQQQGVNVDTLSMGMTGDYAAAIAEGATIIRIGTALFGQRNKLLHS